MESSKTATRQQLVLAAVAAFCTYFCMYAFRKPFTAATFEDQYAYGFALKSILVISQLAGYMISKFVGIKVVSEMRREQRAVAMLVLVLFAEAALIGFAYVPNSLRPFMLFLNGLPLGLIFGLVLAYLEGRRHTEALSAALCASFIISSGVVKSVGRWLIIDWGVSEFSMPMVTGAIFFVPMLISLWLLQTTPPPGKEDRKLRAERNTMSSADRRRFTRAYWPGLSMFVLVYIAITVIRTIRDDFGVEIWRDMGIDQEPSVFARSETIVAIAVTVLNGLAFFILGNLKALRVTVAMMVMSFVGIAASTWLQLQGTISPFAFMVACGIGLYVPYVAFHTTVFERVVAASKHPCNLGFLMYLADAMGYLGYAVVLASRSALQDNAEMLPFFRTALWIVSGVSFVGLAVGLVYFLRVLDKRSEVTMTAPSLAQTEDW